MLPSLPFSLVRQEGHRFLLLLARVASPPSILALPCT